MNRPGTAAIAIFGAVVLAAVAIGAVLLVGTDGATAVRVGDRRISRESVNEELRAIADNTLLAAGVAPMQVSRSNGSVRADASAALVLTPALQEAVILEILARRDEEVTRADRRAARELTPRTTLGQYAEGFPRWFRERSTERLAAYVALARVLGTDLTADAAPEVLGRALRRAARKLSISVDPAYGEYRSRTVQVVPVRARRRAGAPQG